MDEEGEAESKTGQGESHMGLPLFLAIGYVWFLVFLILKDFFVETELTGWENPYC